MVKRFDASLMENVSYSAFASNFSGGVRVAVGDVTGDGIDEIIAGAGPGGGPQVRVFGGGCQPAVRDFLAYSPGFSGGVFVAAGDISGDGKADIITGSDVGMTAQIKVFDSTTLAELRNFQPFGTFTGGVRVASGDVTGDGRADLIVGAGPGGAPRVIVFDGVTNAPVFDFFAYEPTFTGGVYVAGGDVTGDGRADIIVGAGPGGSPRVSIFSGSNGSLVRTFLAFDSAYKGGVRVGAGRFTADSYPEIILSGGNSTGIPDEENGSLPADGGTQIKVFDLVSNSFIRDFQAYPSNLTTGVFVAAPPIANPAPVSISGRVATPGGLGLRNATVTLTDPLGTRRTATTSSFGVYTFENVRSGEVHILGVLSKRYRFAPKTLLVNSNLVNVDFVGLE